MQIETYENKKTLSEPHYEQLVTLLHQYNDVLAEALQIVTQLQEVCEPISHQATGELNQYFKFNEHQKKLEIMLKEFQYKISLQGKLQ